MTIFKFLEISAFLRAFIDSQPQNGRGQVSQIAKAVGVSSTLISHVLSGKKWLTSEQGFKLAQHLELSELEGDYLQYLIQLERAGHHEIRKFWRQKIEEMRKQAAQLQTHMRPDRELTEAEKAAFYAHPLYSAIRLFTSLHERGATPEQIASRFDISRAQALSMLRFLVETQLCKEQDGFYILGAQKTYLEPGSPHLLKHHANWRLRAIRRSENLTPDELMYTAPISISKKDFEALRAMTVDFIKLSLAKVHASEPDEIACLNIDLFWIQD